MMFIRHLTRAVASKPLAPSTVFARSYHANVIDHYESPRNVGSLDKKDPSVGTGMLY